MVNFKITKREKLLEVNNDMCHNWYYLFHGRIYNEEKTKYKKFKFVFWFDILDLQEYFDKELITKEDIKCYLQEMGYTYLENIKSYDDTEGLKKFYSYCNETIERYNNI